MGVIYNIVSECLVIDRPLVGRVRPVSSTVRHSFHRALGAHAHGKITISAANTDQSSASMYNGSFFKNPRIKIQEKPTRNPRLSLVAGVWPLSIADVGGDGEDEEEETFFNIFTGKDALLQCQQWICEVRDTHTT